MKKGGGTTRPEKGVQPTVTPHLLRRRRPPSTPADRGRPAQRAKRGEELKKRGKRRGSVAVEKKDGNERRAFAKGKSGTIKRGNVL